MTPDIWERLKPLYHAALEIPEEERANFISSACGDDAQVREELAALLKATDESTAFGDSPIISFKGLFPTKADPFSVGALILDRFRIVRHLGAGGMGDVYEATDSELGRIALKTIRADIASNPDMLSRFRKEVQLARKISGPHVCRIHELFVLTSDKIGSHRAFLTMEFLEGVTLADRLRRSGPLPWSEAQPILIEICDGLQTIHQAGIIHRDLKSQNIMLASRNGSMCAVLMDFGLARELSTPTTSTMTDLTMPGMIVGTPNYMAPEQFEGKEISPATDIYALGIVLYELVTGKHPFAASSPIGAAILRGRRPCSASSIRPGLPHRVDEVICKCLEFDANRRYQSAEAVAEDLGSRLFSVVWFRHRWPRVLAVTASLVLLLSSLLLIPAVRERLQGMLFSSREKHIVVLPFDIVGDAPGTQALGDGLMDSLAGKLSNLGATNKTLFVVPPSEVRSRKVSDPASAMRQFGATIVVKGKFERNGEATQLRLTLIDPKKMREIGFADIENQTGDLSALQDEAVTRLARLTNISTGSEPTRTNGESADRAAYEDYLLALGYIQRFDKAGNLDLAIKALRNATTKDPHFALGFARLAQVYIMKYHMEPKPQWLVQAETYGKRAAELDDRIPLTYVVLGKIHEYTGNHDLAIPEFQRALDLDPRNAEALSGMADSYSNVGRNSEAEAAYIRAAELRPDNWAGYNRLGNFYERVGKHAEALAQFQKAFELTPDNSALYLNLGNELLDQGDPSLLPEAEKAFRKSIDLNPTFQAYTGLGMLLQMQHRYGDGVAACKEAARLGPDDYDVWNNLTMAYEWIGDNENAASARKTAIGLLREAVKTNPQDASAQATLAALLAKNGVRKEALDRIGISLALSPDSGYVLSEAADTYELTGDRAQAIKCLKNARQHGIAIDEMYSDPEIRSVIPAAGLPVDWHR
jgi:serine/threonine protein kinase/tetratricopeptide (TPR) repeat protein